MRFSVIQFSIQYQYHFKLTAKHKIGADETADVQNSDVRNKLDPVDGSKCGRRKGTKRGYRQDKKSDTSHRVGD